MAIPTLRMAAASLGAVAVASLLITGAAQAATTTVECGLFRDYVAPDPVAPADGSITFGLSASPEIIAADATLVPPADTNLSSLGGGAPTALTVVRDLGVITSLAFAPSCTLTGDVVFVPDLFGPGADGYTVNDRLFAPTALMGINDGLAALIPTAAANGSQLSIQFTIDTTIGTPSAFHAGVTLVGGVKLKPNGDIVVGSARLPASTVSDAARERLREAHRLGVVATVDVSGEGAPDNAAPGGVAMAITLAVSFETGTPAPTPSGVPDTSVRPTVSHPTDITPWLAILLFLAAAAGAAASVERTATAG